MSILFVDNFCNIISQVEEVELKQNGGDIEVTEENKKEYVK